MISNYNSDADIYQIFFNGKEYEALISQTPDFQEKISCLVDGIKFEATFEWGKHDSGLLKLENFLNSLLD